MSTAAAIQRVQTSGLLSLALLITLTGDINPIDEHTSGSENAVWASPNCAQVINANHGPSQAAAYCKTLSEFETVLPPPMRLVRPTSGNQYRRLGESTRYSF